MSSIEIPAPTRSTKASIAILIAALVACSVLALSQSFLLKWPLGAGISGASPTPSPSPPISVLSVNAQANQSIGGVSATFHISDATVTVSLPGRGTFVDSGSTNFLGQTQFQLFPGSYQVTLTSIYGNATAFVSTIQNDTTELNILVSQSSYESSYYQIGNSLSSGIITPWDKIYLGVASNTQLFIAQGANETVRLFFEIQTQTQTCNGHVCSFLELSEQEGFQIISEYYSSSDATLWLEIELNSAASMTNLASIELVTYVSSYTTSVFRINQTMTTTISLTGSR